MLRVKEIAKQQGKSMIDIAKALNISPVNLSSSLNGNPTLRRLEEVAKVLRVPVSELFSDNTENVCGVIYYKNKKYNIDSIDDIRIVLRKIESMESIESELVNNQKYTSKVI